MTTSQLWKKYLIWYEFKLNVKQLWHFHLVTSKQVTVKLKILWKVIVVLKVKKIFLFFWCDDEKLLRKVIYFENLTLFVSLLNSINVDCDENYSPQNSVLSCLQCKWMTVLIRFLWLPNFLFTSEQNNNKKKITKTEVWPLLQDVGGTRQAQVT